VSSKAEVMNTKQSRLKTKQRNGSKAEEVETVDYKMVTFTLGGKDYAVDILKVKEIAKFAGFTYVPNTPAYVAGVFNLRGEIISIIDLRIMFGLPVEKRPEGEPERGLILRLNDMLIGVIVDSIDRVVGINSSRIQPPHPIFGDINIKYISGVVDKDDRLYIILDVERIFGRESQEAEEQKRLTLEGQLGAAAAASGAPAVGAGMQPGAGEQRGEPGTEDASAAGTAASAEELEAAQDQFELDLTFIKEALASYEQFHAGALNADWITTRYEQWRSERKAAQRPVQFESGDDALEFLRGFYSRDSGRFWGPEQVELFREVLPERLRNTITVWNPGAGKGFESYSLACLLKKAYPDSTLKIWASDNDLLSISTAPNLVFREDDLPSFYREFTVEGSNGYSFAGMIKDSVFFEYHDITHANAVPEMDIIVARDLLSFLSPEQQATVLNEFYEKLLDHGLLILGDNETGLDDRRWQRVQGARIAAFQKK